MERLDKIISQQTNYSRKEIKKLITQKRITINECLATNSNLKINPNLDVIKIDNEQIQINEHIYLILNKPQGYVSATLDKKDKTVLDLVPSKYLHRNLFPAGRLDKDTTGLMLITDDGHFAHNILSPKKHVSKTYIATIDIPVTGEMIEGFKKGVMLNDDVCQTATLEIIDEYTAQVTLTEGRYHQIKRMFGCFKAKVLKLERIKMGSLEMPSNLKRGECRELTCEELTKIQTRQ